MSTEFPRESRSNLLVVVELKDPTKWMPSHSAVTELEHLACQMFTYQGQDVSMNESEKSTQYPLGMLTYEQLDPSMQESVRRCQEFDLSRVQRRLTEHGLLPESWIDECVLEFRRYMILNLVQPNKQPMFSPYVDEVWHQTILFTRMYHELGQSVAGRYFHHEPLDGDDPTGDGEADAVSFDEFRATYEHFYGPLPEIWTRHTTGRVAVG